MSSGRRQTVVICEVCSTTMLSFMWPSNVPMLISFLRKCEDAMSMGDTWGGADTNGAVGTGTPIPCSSHALAHCVLLTEASQRLHICMSISAQHAVISCSHAEYVRALGFKHACHGTRAWGWTDVQVLTLQCKQDGPCHHIRRAVRFWASSQLARQPAQEHPSPWLARRHASCCPR